MHGKHSIFCSAGYILMALILVTVMITVPANAYTVLDEVIDDTAVSSINYKVSGSYGVHSQPARLSITNAENVALTDFTLVYFSKIYNHNASINANQTAVTFELSGETVGSGFVTYYRDADLNGYITVSGKFTESLGTGNKFVYIKGPGGASLATALDGLRVTSATTIQKVTGSMDENQMGLTGETSTIGGYAYVGKYTLNRIDDFWHRITIENSSTLIYKVLVQKTKLDKAYGSHVIISGASGEYVNESGIDDVFRQIGEPDLPISVDITSVTGNYNFVYPPYIDPPEIEYDVVNVYVKNSQNGALIANSHILISAYVNGEFHEVVNETLPGGIYTGNLQPTGGGLPNPDYYRLIATAEGYNSIMPYIDFEHGSDTTIYAILDPIGGAPEDENNTFIDFYVRDINANPIAGATVKFGGYTLYTNNAGYTIFEVKKDNTYTWSVSKLGYGSVTGNAVIGSNARYTVNAVIAPEVTPTIPTPIPSVTPIRPTPTLTAPNGEPVSNWLEWFAAHFGMILGGGVEIGKIFMWLCFTVPVGVYVGNKAKAGAAGFMAGAGIVTLFFVLIGWVPIWLVVLLALIIGLLYAKIYSNTDNGGGR